MISLKKIENKKYHEAGHAFIAIYHSEVIEEIKLDFENDVLYVRTPGEYDKDYSKYNEDDEIRNITDNQLQVIYAGLFSEYNYKRRTEHGGIAALEFDNFLFHEFLRLKNLNKVTDYHNIEKIKKGLCDSLKDHEIKNLDNKNIKEAERLISKYWKCIEKIVKHFNVTLPNVNKITKIVENYLSNN